MYWIILIGEVRTLEAIGPFDTYAEAKRSADVLKQWRQPRIVTENIPAEHINPPPSRRLRLRADRKPHT